VLFGGCVTSNEPYRSEVGYGVAFEFGVNILKGLNGIKKIPAQVITFPDEQKTLINPPAVFFALNYIGTFLNGLFKGRGPGTNGGIQGYHKNRQVLGIVVFVGQHNFLHGLPVPEFGIVQAVETGGDIMVLTLYPGLSMGTA
jgi:hypothetical protein